jgi:hypothetical protein
VNLKGCTGQDLRINERLNEQRRQINRVYTGYIVNDIKYIVRHKYWNDTTVIVMFVADFLEKRS